MTPELTRRTVGRARHGAALVAALFTIAVLASLTAVASSQARQSAAVVQNRRSQAAARAMAESGVIAARLRIESQLAAVAGDSVRTDALLAALTAAADAPDARGALLQDSIGDGVFAVVVVDVSARLDVNTAGAEGLQRLFATVTSASEAQQVADAIDARVRGSGLVNDANAQARRVRDSIGAVLLGRSPSSRAMQPFRSLDELLTVAGMRTEWLNAVAGDLTVDGDGRVNRRAASARVLAAATGTLVDRPSRLLLVSRGWRSGQVLTREIQAVYDVIGTELRLVRWREQDR
jgi:type II secretory pathway component PulK